jgi:aldehyde dehydrogenase (NAD+)
MVSESSSIKYTKLFINNEFVDAASKKTFPSFNPCNGQKIADVAEAAKEDVDKAVAAAKAAFSRNSEWRKMDASVRGKLINQVEAAILKNLQSARS